MVDMWHSDVSCVDMPVAVNFLCCANMERAWDSLGMELQETLKPMDAFFSTHRFENDSPL